MMQSRVFRGWGGKVFDAEISKAGLMAALRGCKLYSLHSARANLTTNQEISEILGNDRRAASVFKDLLRNRNISLKEAGIGFSFVVVDGRDVAIEIVNPYDPKDFFAGLAFESVDIASRLIAYFSELERTAMDDRRKALLRD